MTVVYNMEAKSHLLIANLRTFFDVAGESREIFKLQFFFFFLILLYNPITH